jgi:hypothetical protein
MQVTINIPDKLYHDIEQIDENLETSIIQALEIYTERKKMIKNDPLYKWMQTPVAAKNNESDISENHDKYLYDIDI